MSTNFTSALVVAARFHALAACAAAHGGFWVSAAGARASVRDASVRRGGRPEPQGQTSHPRPGRLTRARASGQAPLRRARDLPVEVDRRPVEDQVAHRGMRTGPHRGRREQPPAQGDGGQQTALVLEQPKWGGLSGIPDATGEWRRTTGPPGRPE